MQLIQNVSIVNTNVIPTEWGLVYISLTFPVQPISWRHKVWQWRLVTKQPARLIALGGMKKEVVPKARKVLMTAGSAIETAPGRDRQIRRRQPFIALISGHPVYNLTPSVILSFACRVRCPCMVLLARDSHCGTAAIHVECLVTRQREAAAVN